MRLAPHRGHRLDPGRGAGVDVGLAEYPLSAINVATVPKAWQSGDFVQHRRKLLLVGRLHDIGRDHQQNSSQTSIGKRGR
jgi:hypothetical protein